VIRFGSPIRTVYLTYFVNGLPLVIGVEPGTWAVEHLHINGQNFTRMRDTTESVLRALEIQGIDFIFDARKKFNEMLPAGERVS
jgi:hypothetical protein